MNFIYYQKFPPKSGEFGENWEIGKIREKGTKSGDLPTNREIWSLLAASFGQKDHLVQPIATEGATVVCTGRA